MTYTVLLHPKAAQSIDKIGAPTRKRIKERLAELKEDPEDKGIRLRHT